MNKNEDVKIKQEHEWEVNENQDVTKGPLAFSLVT